MSTGREKPEFLVNNVFQKNCFFAIEMVVRQMMLILFYVGCLERYNYDNGGKINISESIFIQKHRTHFSTI